MSLAMSAAPLAVRVPATAQLLLPTGGVRTAAASGGVDIASRTLSTAASGTGTGALAAATGPAAASQLVPAGYRKPSAHFQPAAQSGPPSRVLISCRSI